MEKVETKITKTCDRCKQETDRLYFLYELVAFTARKFEDLKLISDLCKPCRDKLKLFLEEK